MRIALVSLDQKWMDKKENLVRCSSFVAEAQDLECELIVFPEMTLTGYSLDMHSVAELEQESFTLSNFGILAKKAGLSIIFGACLIEENESLPRNKFCIALPDGTSRAIYSKIHPFSYAGEDKLLQAGSRVASAKIGLLEFGASICYDLRFPELYSAIAPNCNAAIAIANWPLKRVAHWRALLVARAIENQFYMFGVNRIGLDDNGLLYEKSTLVVSPDGLVHKPLKEGMEIDFYDIDIEDTARYRADFPTVRDKRYMLYRNFFGGLIDVK
jgi:omega-amidase